MGGTGKTPFIMFFMDQLCDLKVGYVSRGYRRKGKGCYIATGVANPEEAGDEASLIVRTHPLVRICVFEDKWKAIQAIQQDVDLIILDDGLQRYDIPTSVSIAMVDAQCPDGYGGLFPRGLLREPWSRLNTVDAIVITNGTSAEIEKRIPLDPIEVVCRITSLHSAAGIAHFVPTGPVALFSAIAKPERFLRSIQELGVTVVDHLVFQDHEEISERRSLSFLSQLQTKYPNITLIGTEKDWARQANWPDGPLLFAKMEISISKGDTILRELLQKTRSLVSKGLGKNK